MGIVDNDLDMLKMACRMALSVAHCKNFHEGIMGAFPGATWHHRSFEEAYVCMSLVEVLDWAGGLLTWHGKNIIYDSIIMKGLPRLDADIKTMDYIWTMNQGPIFASHLIIILLSLQKRYPRYAGRVAEAEKDLLTMWEMYLQEDGGVAEGPTYWSFTLTNMTNALYLLARYHNMPLEEYVPESIRKSVAFAEALLSNQGNRLVTVNDTHPGNVYHGKTIGLLAKMNVGDIWRQMNNEYLEASENNTKTRDDLIFGEIYNLEDAKLEKQEFISLPVTGHTTLRRKTSDLGLVTLHAISGAITFGHAHGDKGSFILDADGTPLLIDRGVCDYGNAYVNIIDRSELHNVIIPVLHGRNLAQNMEDPACSAKVLESSYENGVFTYETDVTASWEGAFAKNVRKITSKDPHCYVIEDTLKIDKKYSIYYNKFHKGYWLSVKPGWYYGCGEYGAEGLDSAEVMTECYPKEWLTKPFDPGRIIRAQAKDFHYFFYDTPDSMEEWIEKSQEHQAFGTRMMTEAFRRDDRMVSNAIHLFIDAWPAGWMKSIMDCKRIPKKAYFAYRNALEPVMVSLRTDRFTYYAGEKISIESYLCNDTNNAGTYTLKFEYYVDGNYRGENFKEVAVGDCQAVYAANAEFIVSDVSDRKHVLVRAILLDEQGAQITYNELSLTVFVDVEVKENENVILIEKLPVGTHEIAGEIVNVKPCGMLSLHFASRKTGHQAVEGFEPGDFSYWYDKEADMITPLLDTTFESSGFTPILTSGNMDNEGKWKPVLACAEKLYEGKRYVICQLDLREENPAARRLKARIFNL